MLPSSIASTSVLGLFERSAEVVMAEGMSVLSDDSATTALLFVFLEYNSGWSVDVRLLDDMLIALFVAFRRLAYDIFLAWSTDKAALDTSLFRSKLFSSFLVLSCTFVNSSLAMFRSVWASLACNSAALSFSFNVAISPSMCFYGIFKPSFCRFKFLL